MKKALCVMIFAASVLLSACGNQTYEATTAPVRNETATAAQTQTETPAETEPQTEAETEPAQTETDPTDIGVWYSTWYAYTEPGSDNNRYDTWNAWNIDFIPQLPDGTFGYYDSADENVIRFHLEKLSEAQIDFIIMDQTNNIDVDGGYINERSLAVAKYIKTYNDSGARPVRYCSAVGGIQWSQDAKTIEDEAEKLWSRYCEQDFGGEDYHYYLDGKPLMIVYGDGAEQKWNEYEGDKTYGEKFTIRWADNKNTPGYFGWAYNKGPVWDGGVTVVMPGWHNRAGHTPVGRKYGETYKRFWKAVLEAGYRPEIIIINSFNEYAERTAVFPAASTDKTEKGDRWYKDTNKTEDPFMYWEMTVSFIKQFKEMKKPLYGE